MTLFSQDVQGAAAYRRALGWHGGHIGVAWRVHWGQHWGSIGMEHWGSMGMEHWAEH